jgi:Xaa-Pro aminopeptidase
MINKPIAVPLASRVAALQKRLPTWRADAILLIQPRDIRYLTGFVGDDSWAVVTLKGKKVTLISDSRFDEEIDQTAPQATKVIRDTKSSLIDALDKVLLSLGVRHLAVQEQYITVQTLAKMGEKIKGVSYIPVSDGMIDQRSIKDASEVAKIRQAVKIQQDAFKALIDYIKPGMTELQAAAYLEFRMMDMGAEMASFQSIIGAGANASLPHYRPGLAKIEKNNIVLIDWGARYHGYHSDMTRTIALGKMPAKIQEIYKVVHEAQMAAIAAIKPGASCKEIDTIARDIINKAGYEKQYQHGLGHGIGLQIHESPRFGQTAEGELKPGAVVTVEPGIYLPGIGGVRLEDDVLVTGKGHEVLCDLPKGVESAII